MSGYIYQRADWPEFTWDNELLLPQLGNVRNFQGKFIGKMTSLGFEIRKEAVLENLTQDVIRTSEIEGEFLDLAQVRSSIARRLGMDISGLVDSDHNVDGIVEMLLDATTDFDKRLTIERLFDWHCALFPTGRSGMYKIIVGNWRDDSTGPMQMVSGALGKEKVHFQAPEAKKVPHEMERFISWFNDDSDLDLVIKAAIAHLWFVTIHPFEDGNGRIARALADMLLTRSDGVPGRFYSMSTQIRNELKEYYRILESTQRGLLDITPWLLWFSNCLMNAINGAEVILEKVLFKHKFWNIHATQILTKVSHIQNPHQMRNLPLQ